MGLRERIVSRENIFLSIYLVDSYILNKNLLSKKDQLLLAELKDIFNYEKINETILLVEQRINSVLDNEDDYFESIVYFKPKKMENNIHVFRPLHTASLIDQIAMIAMLQVLVFELDENDKIIPSEFSRLIPSNFYGNRISFDGERLFKPWQKQYQDYIKHSNDLSYEYSRSLKYEYEVNLDLKNFFPSINPKVMFGFISKHLPNSYHNSENKDYEILQIVLKKLLFFKISKLNKEETKWYLRKNDVNKSLNFVKGLPQGLPHVYFMANLYMLIIKDLYKEYFSGEMLFYVDDSIIFTNEIDEENQENFGNKIKKINSDIKEYEKNIYDSILDQFVPKDYDYKDNDFGVEIHDPEGVNSKSTFQKISYFENDNSIELDLKNLSRETSNLGFDFKSMFSDEDVFAVSSRTDSIYVALDRELKNNSDKYSEVYLKKLYRFKKYFLYRKILLDYKKSGDIQELEKQLISDLKEGNEKFYEEYNNGILEVCIQFVYEHTSLEGRKKLNIVLNKRINSIYGEKNINHSYIYKIYESYLANESNNSIYYDKYKSLYENISIRFKNIRKLVLSQRKNWIKEDYLNVCLNIFDEKDTELCSLSKYYTYVMNTNDNIMRMILNAVFSYVCGYDLNDNSEFAKKDRTPMKYSEIRILMLLRNRRFNLKEFKNEFNKYIEDEYWETCDYSLLYVLNEFKTFVCIPKRIDELILIHKYCSDTWKNGSKYLHFYTLHNEEHAVELIKSSIRILHSISYFKIKKIDYFILFAACYLHDISMVTIPNLDNFYINSDENANYIYSEFVDRFSDVKNNSTKSKQLLCETYKNMEAYYENKVRSSHAEKSANEIRKFNELNFLEPAIRDVIAEVSEGHGIDAEDIYCRKSRGKKELINIKFIKILLRLSDLMDMSRYRISRVVLKHNLQNLSSISRFHWLSHLITDQYSFETEYQLPDKDCKVEEILKNKNIKEKLIINVDVFLNQTDEIDVKAKCKNISKCIQNDNKLEIYCANSERCENKKCNFLCKWFVTKNKYLFDELSYLQEYLTSIPDNLFQSEIVVCINPVTGYIVPNEVIDYLRENISS